METITSEFDQFRTIKDSFRALLGGLDHPQEWRMSAMLPTQAFLDWTFPSQK